MAILTGGVKDGYVADASELSSRIKSFIKMKLLFPTMSRRSSLTISRGRREEE